MQYAAFRSLKGGISYHKTAFSGIKMLCFIAQKGFIWHNILSYKALRLHTFPWRLCALPTFILQNAAYSGVVENQKESNKPEFQTLCTNIMSVSYGHCFNVS